jgi:hypothetical protein
MMLLVVKIGIEASTKQLFGNRFGSDDRKRSAIVLMNIAFLVAVVSKMNADVAFADVDAVEVNDFPFERQEMIGMRYDRW